MAKHLITVHIEYEFEIDDDDIVECDCSDIDEYLEKYDLENIKRDIEWEDVVITSTQISE